MAAIGVHLGCTSACVAVYKVRLGSWLRLSWRQPCSLGSGSKAPKPCVRASGDVAGSPLTDEPSPLHGGRVDTEGISGTPGFPTGLSGLLSPLRRSGHGKAMGYPEESPAPQACRVHLGGRGHRMTRKVQKMSGLRMPGGVPGPSFL